MFRPFTAHRTAHRCEDVFFVNISPQSHFREISNNKNTVFTRHDAGQIYDAYWFIGFLSWSVAFGKASIWGSSINARSWNRRKLLRLVLPQTLFKTHQLLKVFGSLMIADIRSSRSIGYFHFLVSLNVKVSKARCLLFADRYQRAFSHATHNFD